MVDLTGKFYLMEELDEAFVKECVDVENIRNMRPLGEERIRPSVHCRRKIR